MPMKVWKTTIRLAILFHFQVIVNGVLWALTGSELSFWEHLRCFLRKTQKQSIRRRLVVLVFWFWHGVNRVLIQRPWSYLMMWKPWPCSKLPILFVRMLQKLWNTYVQKMWRLRLFLVTILWRFLILPTRLVLRIIKVILTVLRSVMRSWRLWLKILQSLVAYLHIRRSC